MDLDSHSANHISPSERIDQLCDDFEVSWLQGERPQIANFIDRIPAEDQPALFYELMLVELEYRLKAGEQPSREEYLRDFPQFSDQVSAVYLQFGGDAFATAAAKKDGTVRRRGHQPGDHIGHFELRDVLGSGAMGSVWKAWDPRLQRPVAIKIPRAENLSDDEKHRFLREGRSVAQLRHPNLAAVHEVDRDGDTPYIASEFVDGENLRDYCERSNLAVTTATTESMNRRLTFYAIADLCAEIAEALHHAHEQGVVHRDLKPANIIIDRANRPHVIDFGLAKWSTDDRDLTLHGELLGTPAYMSPEQAAGKASKVDRRTDVYSLGVVLYELLCGQCPFLGEMGSVIHQIIAAEPPAVRKLNTKVPRDLETICTKALGKDPDRRYATMQELAVDLRRFARGEPILARRAGPIERSWRIICRHPMATAAAIIVLAVAALAGVEYRALSDANYRLEGFRPVVITTNPDGGHVAIVPIDRRTGEPDPAGEIKRGVAPFSLFLKPGNYFIEAVPAERGSTREFAEILQSIPEEGRTPIWMREWNVRHKLEEDTFKLTIAFREREEVLANMLAVRIPERLRRKNPDLPKLLYVDAQETNPAKRGGDAGEPFSYASAMQDAFNKGKRLPSAAEYDAIVEALNNPEPDDGNDRARAQIKDLSSGLAEWTSTRYQNTTRVFAGPAASNLFENMQVLKGYDDPSKLQGIERSQGGAVFAPLEAQSPSIGYRGVHSDTPRFAGP